MGPISYLLDSTVLIDFINEVPKALAFIESNHSISWISPVTRAEVLAGTTDKNLKSLSEWLSEFQYLVLDLPCVDLAAKLRREHRWKLPDAFQAAMATHHKLKLVTRNTRDFPPGKYDFVTVPYKI